MRSVFHSGWWSSVLTVLLCFCFGGSELPAAPKPNIILMMADDMGMGDTSAFQDFTGNAGDVQLHTPAMERLARMGTRFTDAHTPASRCTPTRYGLLTGRYPWRSRMKWWVLFGAQGDPLIEADRPTIASLLRGAGYRTAIFGKWHVGLRYRRADGSPAAGWEDADLTQPLHTGPLDQGFDVAMFTSRSHGTSGPDPTLRPKNKSKRNGPKQDVGPGHIHGRTAVGATKNGKELIADGAGAYVLKKLGSRHSDNAIGFLTEHVRDTPAKPFFLYYPANSNHSPYTPDDAIGATPVTGAARTKSGRPMDARHDFIYENDVALGRLLDWLDSTDDPRNPGRKMAANTLVIFTSDNGAEKDSDIATGPFRSHKGSCYEGGHRVPFIAAWPEGGVKAGATSRSPIGLQDLLATFAEIVDVKLPNLAAGEKGGEDSFSMLRALRGEGHATRPPLFFNDHKEAKADHAVVAMRSDSPVVGGRPFPGQWKVLFDARLLRQGVAEAYELYDLATDGWESMNRVAETDLKPLVAFLEAQAARHRNVPGQRLVSAASERRIIFDWRGATPLAPSVAGKGVAVIESEGVKMTVRGHGKGKVRFDLNPRGLGLAGGTFKQVDDAEALEVSFDRDLIVESAAVVAGNGVCGGFYTVGGGAPRAIYCVDADNDAKEQEGIISDIGVLKQGEILRLDSAPHFGVEPAGRWRLGAVTVRLMK